MYGRPFSRVGFAGRTVLFRVSVAIAVETLRMSGTRLPNHVTTRSPTGPFRLSRTAGYWLVAGTIGVALLGSATPTPLYGIYREQWGFSPFVLTAIFAVYALSVLVTLIGFGRISDDIGRRPTLLGAIAMMLVGTALFVWAQSAVWLFVARILQGLGTGVAMGAAGAALLDLHPQGDSLRAGRLNSLVSTTSMGMGVVLAAILVEYGPAPLKTPYLLVIAMLVVLLIGVALMPEPVEQRRRPSLRLERPSVPREIRGAFVLAGLGILASWSVGGLFLSLGPQLAAIELGTDNRVATSLGVFALTAAGTLAQVIAGRVDPQRLMSGGALVLAVGMAATIGSLSLGSTPVFLISAAILGVGWGTAFLGALGSLTGDISAEHRAAVMSALYIVAYLSMAVPALAAGLVATSWDLVSTFRVFGAVVIVVALVVTVGTIRLRPSAPPDPAVIAPVVGGASVPPVVAPSTD